jgi:hypothetical protein
VQPVSSAPQTRIVARSGVSSDPGSTGHHLYAGLRGEIRVMQIVVGLR